jgi:hypothetical protein
MAKRILDEKVAVTIRGQVRMVEVAEYTSDNPQFPYPPFYMSTEAVALFQKRPGQKLWPEAIRFYRDKATGDLKANLTSTILNRAGYRAVAWNDEAASSKMVARNLSQHNSAAACPGLEAPATPAVDPLAVGQFVIVQVPAGHDLFGLNGEAVEVIRNDGRWLSIRFDGFHLIEARFVVPDNGTVPPRPCLTRECVEAGTDWPSKADLAAIERAAAALPVPSAEDLEEQVEVEAAAAVQLGLPLPAGAEADPALAALAVIALTPHIREYLTANDPKALAQVEAAILGLGGPVEPIPGFPVGGRQNCPLDALGQSR